MSELNERIAGHRLAEEELNMAAERVIVGLSAPHIHDHVVTLAKELTLLETAEEIVRERREKIEMSREFRDEKVREFIDKKHDRRPTGIQIDNVHSGMPTETGCDDPNCKSIEGVCG